MNDYFGYWPMAKGKELDYIGSLWGIKRHKRLRIFREHDQHYRDRLCSEINKIMSKSTISGLYRWVIKSGS